MSPRSNKAENQPFLKHQHDDPTISDIELEQGQQHANHRRSHLSYLLVFVATSILWLGMIYILTSPRAHLLFNGNTNDHHNITSGARLVTCGDTTDEARAHGCKYDMLLNAWVPAQCWDDEFIMEYQDDDSWGAFADEGLTQRLTIEQMSESESYFTSVRDHINHCGMMWKKQFWVLFEERPAFDSMIASPGHTDHCAHYLMGVVDMKPTEATKVERGFAGCWVKES